MPKNGGEGGRRNRGILVQQHRRNCREFFPRNRCTNGIAVTNGTAALYLQGLGKFSKLSALVYLLHKVTIENTFANYCLRAHFVETCVCWCVCVCVCVSSCLCVHTLIHPYRAHFVKTRVTDCVVSAKSD